MEQLLAWHQLVLVFAMSNILESLAMTVLPIITEIQFPVLAQVCLNHFFSFSFETILLFLYFKFVLLAGFTTKNLVTLFIVQSHHLLRPKPNVNLWILNYLNP